jgi:heavy metal sensor kinase
LKPSSIRFRLTAWYFAVGAIALSAFGVGAWLAMRSSLNHAVDDSLRDRVQGVKRFMDEQIAALSVVEIRDEFREHSVLGPGGDLFQVSDASGSWLYRSVPFEENGLSARPPATLPESGVYETLTLQGTPLRVFSARVTVHEKPYTVQVAAPMHEMEEALTRFQWALVLSVPLILAASTAGGYLMSRRALAPVDEVIAEARSISIENLSARLSVPATGDELERLSLTLNEMLSRLQASVESMAQFTADASHELRAPTALIRTTAEVTLRRERTPEEYSSAIREMLTEAEHMTHLVDSLLLLARADAQSEGLDLAQMDLISPARDAYNEMRLLAAEKGVELSFRFPAGGVPIRGDTQSLRRLFLILIDNAVKYTPSGGKVVVEIQIENAEAIVTVADTGIGIASEDLPRVFDRFWRADKVRSRETGGVGLGLSIARWIVERHGGRIEAQSELGRGSTLKVFLPC